ncbi:hypothetical protein QC761_209100 [Podospora bellae-mahoneyi]|uniref:Uncharacterized protein n=1 Tax=Podospora bellae-mahoneyi TaxID=2093777 RepID=A0ABR0FQQ8_9PEZI|nr:hypothetical protein QC761_209100 [Podospora bellae-mahoneyi]
MGSTKKNLANVLLKAVLRAQPKEKTWIDTSGLTISIMLERTTFQGIGWSAVGRAAGGVEEGIT